MKVYPESFTMFLLPPSIAKLKDRLTKRGTEEPDVVQKRIDNATAEIKRAM